MEHLNFRTGLEIEKGIGREFLFKMSKIIKTTQESQGFLTFSQIVSSYIGSKKGVIPVCYKK